MRDLPEGPSLLAFARDVLLDELLPLLPPERRLDARLVANCMAIAMREATANKDSGEKIARELSKLYESAPSRPLPRQRGRAGVGAAVADSERGATNENAAALPHRFARDLRIGAFENSEPQAAAARAIMWRMTIERLRLSNPRFLAANGVTGPKG
jgi:hypothetical protein